MAWYCLESSYAEYSNLIGQLGGSESRRDSEEGTTCRCPCSQGTGHLHV